jgi:nicotinate dehydrogenase subunit B
MSTPAGLDRREFFRLAGGGIVMLVGLDGMTALAQDFGRPYPQDFNAYLVIGNDGRVTVFSGKIEMGQGVMTSQAQMLAEELGVDLAAIDMVLGDTDRCPWDMGTFGSLTTRMFGPALRAAGAQARLTLIELAAGRLGVPAERLTASSGMVSVAGEPARKVSYAELSRGARIAKVVDRKAVLRAASRFSVMGQSPARLDGADKVTGAARYAGDIRLPGMLYARILRPPMHGAKLLRIDTAAAQTLPGVTLVKDGDLLAVLHADPEAATAALARIDAQWDSPSAALDPESIFDHIIGTPAPRRTTIEAGDVAGARSRASKVIELSYRKGYVAHAPIETHAALAEVRGGKATVWASTQTPFPTRDLVAQALKMKPDDVRVITPYVGGGFGGKSASAQAVEAARLARIAGKPVQVMYTRQEEFFYDTFDPAAVVEVASGLDGAGRIAFWNSVVYAAGERGSALLYDIPNTRIELVGRTSLGEAAAGPKVHPFATGPWRAPGANMNVFAIESQIDVMAAAAGADPVEFRLRHLADPRMRKTLQAAAAAFGWKPAAGPSGRGLGVACSIDAGTCVATIAQVKVDRESGKVKVLRMVCAQEMGIVVNPAGAKMQLEGGLTMGLGYALSEELQFTGGRVLDRNFDTYAIPRFADAPRIEAVLVKNDDLAPQGGGEPSITTCGAVIANAVADALGVRLFRLPMTPKRIRDALRAKAEAKAPGRAMPALQRTSTSVRSSSESGSAASRN